MENTYVHGTNALVVELWKHAGIPEGTYFGDLDFEMRFKQVNEKGLKPVVRATYRNTSLERDDVFDSITGVFEKLGVPFPKDALELYQTPVAVYVRGNGNFKRDPRGGYMVHSPRIEDCVVKVLKMDPESEYATREDYIAQARDRNDLGDLVELRGASALEAVA